MCYSPNMLNRNLLRYVQDVRILKESEVSMHIFCILRNNIIKQLLTMESLDMMCHHAWVNIGILRLISHHVQCLHSQLLYNIIHIGGRIIYKETNLDIIHIGESIIDKETNLDIIHIGESMIYKETNLLLHEL